MIIGISGGARTGKDTVAKILRDLFRIESPPKKEIWHCRAFADPIKASCVICERWGLTPGEIMQRFGRAIKSMVHERSFVDGPMSPARIAYNSNVIATDVRFPWELEEIKELGGSIIHISRPGIAVSGRNPNDLSEIFTDEIKDKADWQIDNSGSYQDLRSQAESIGREIMKGFSQ